MENCIFCKILNGEIPSKKLYEDDKVIRSTQGALFQMNVIKTDLESEITKRKQQGYHVYGTALKNAKGLKETQKQTTISHWLHSSAPRVGLRSPAV